jgi:hypothetical protein
MTNRILHLAQSRIIIIPLLAAASWAILVLCILAAIWLGGRL